MQNGKNATVAAVALSLGKFNIVFSIFFSFVLDLKEIRSTFHGVFAACATSFEIMLGYTQLAAI